MIVEDAKRWFIPVRSYLGRFPALVIEEAPYGEEDTRLFVRQTVDEETTGVQVTENRWQTINALKAFRDDIDEMIKILEEGEQEEPEEESTANPDLFILNRIHKHSIEETYTSYTNEEDALQALHKCFEEGAKRSVGRPILGWSVHRWYFNPEDSSWCVDIIDDKYFDNEED